mmetsp:Transcript_18692/g.21487  ORF Transcript_18692/g.21487 Transcript_18692/m.21487 type:complete len:219 (-) Transcript_18692:661-1317(-)
MLKYEDIRLNEIREELNIDSEAFNKLLRFDKSYSSSIFNNEAFVSLFRDHFESAIGPFCDTYGEVSFFTNISHPSLPALPLTLSYKTVSSPVSPADWDPYTKAIRLSLFQPALSSLPTVLALFPALARLKLVLPSCKAPVLQSVFSLTPPKELCSSDVSMGNEHYCRGLALEIENGVLAWRDRGQLRVASVAQARLRIGKNARVLYADTHVVVLEKAF